MPRHLLEYAIVHAQPLAPALVNPRVPRALSDVIVRLLKKNPSKRYPNGAALHEALVAAARGGEGAWEASIFEWEEFPPGKEGGPPERHIVLPARPRLGWPSSLLSSLGAVLHSRWTWRLGLVAAVLLVLVAVARPGRVVPGTRPPDEWGATDVRVDPDGIPSEQAPVPGRQQKRAPCTKGVEVELSDACWHSLKRVQPPDCPSQTIAYKDECLWPVPLPPGVPTSLDGGAPDAR